MKTFSLIRNHFFGIVLGLLAAALVHLPIAHAAENCSIHLETNQATGQPEHIAGVDIKIGNQYLPVRGPLNIEPNDSNGYVEMAPDFDNDNSRIRLAVNNQVTTGHKVGPGMPLILVLTDGNVINIGQTIAGLVETQFGYTLPIQLASGVTLTALTSLDGRPYDSYYKNALRMCMHIKLQNQKTRYVFTAGGRSFTRTTTQVLTVQKEHWSPFGCRSQ